MCGTRTTGGTRKDFKGYAAENKLLRIVPEFYLMSDELKNKEQFTNLLILIKLVSFCTFFSLPHSFFYSLYMKLNHNVVRPLAR
jgi:hypothetical protein